MLILRWMWGWCISAVWRSSWSRFWLFWSGFVDCITCQILWVYPVSAVLLGPVTQVLFLLHFASGVLPGTEPISGRVHLQSGWRHLSTPWELGCGHPGEHCWRHQITGCLDLLGFAWRSWRPVSEIRYRDISEILYDIVWYLNGNDTMIFLDKITFILVVSETSSGSLFWTSGNCHVVPFTKALFMADPAISFESEQVQVAFPIGCLVDWRPATRTRLAWVAFGLGCPTFVIGVLAILSGRLWMLTIMQVPWWNKSPISATFAVLNFKTIHIWQTLRYLRSTSQFQGSTTAAVDSTYFDYFV